MRCSILLGAVSAALLGCAVPTAPGGAGSTTTTTTAPPPPPPTLAATASVGTELSSATLPAVERDCALSTRLADGATLWVFCDTVKSGSFLVTSTAAIAPAGDPTHLVDYTSPTGWPALFLSPTAAEQALVDAQ